MTRQPLSKLRSITSGEEIACSEHGGWQWIVDAVMDHFRVYENGIDLLSTETADVVTIHGEPVAYIDHGYGIADLHEVRAAVFPHEMQQAAE